MFGTNPSNNQLANSQATMRKALANPLMIILAINFLVLTIMALTDLELLSRMQVISSSSMMVLVQL